MDTDSLARAAAAAMWADDRATAAMGMTLDHVTHGAATMSMSVRDDMVNGHNICHGGFIFALADSAFAFACNSHNRISVASGARIEFIRPAQLGDHLSAVATQIHQGRRTGVYDVSVTNSDGGVVAVFRGNSATIGGELVTLDEQGEQQDA
ncbi:phenylacetic acid degradation protein PaaD [Luminiphilus syltensis NOR5-1B]|uniref:Phenylacetic acid degradation protein PaaD n=1 Tax=Luminiphilus syltensis NOR5-1B TaxID=565045 RepID=B8KT83_9GAMM|nr:hydroxyphenylacetyl-CoA thioesterase PaaI [Luminiphilus syltensis]EED36238.1 phenylacetic acid degradation protein PaaD [Luminiphilus syltensis NOR5-1B]